MKKLIKNLSLIFLVSCLGVSYGQEILFVGLYSKTQSGKSGWCRDMEIVRQIATNENEAKQFQKDFVETHKNDSPITKIFKTGKVIIYEFQKPMAGFNCTVRVISWKEIYGGENSQSVMDFERQRISKEFKSDINEITEWQAKKTNVEESDIEIDGISIKLKIVDKANPEKTKTIATFKNPLKDKDASFVMILDGVEGKMNTLPAGETISINIEHANHIAIKLQLTPKKETENQGFIDWAKQKIRSEFSKENGKYKSRNINVTGVRG